MRVDYLCTVKECRELEEGCEFTDTLLKISRHGVELTLEPTLSIDTLLRMMSRHGGEPTCIVYNYRYTSRDDELSWRGTDPACLYVISQP